MGVVTEGLPQEFLSNDDCSLMQVSRASIKPVRNNRRDNKRFSIKSVLKLSGAQWLNREIHDAFDFLGATFSFKVAGMAIATCPGFVMAVLGLVLLHIFVEIAFRRMPLLSFFLFVFLLLGTLCRIVLPVLWYSTRDVISQYGVLVLFSADISIFVLMFTPLLVLIPDQSTSKTVAKFLVDSSEKENAEQQAEVARPKNSLPYRSLAVFQIISGVSIYCVARLSAATEANIAWPPLTTILYGILACTGSVLGRDPCLGSESAPEASQISNESQTPVRPTISQLVAAAAKNALNDTIGGMYIHCIIWMVYGAGMLVYSACLELRICYAIFETFQFYPAMVWVATSLYAWSTIVAMHMNVIQSTGLFIAIFQGDGWQWQTGKYVVWSMCLLLKVVGIGSMSCALFCSAIGWPMFLFNDVHVRVQVMSMLFFIGLVLVAAEEAVSVNKSAVMLLLAATEWAVLGQCMSHTKLLEEENRDLLDVAGIILFLLPAMAVIESIDHFEGFDVVTRLIQWVMNGNKERLMPAICLLVFLLGSLIDNITVTLMAFKIIRRLLPHDDVRRHECSGLVVIAANAGGVWSPMGDVTTTMLWIQGKIGVWPTIVHLFLPSLVSLMVPLIGISLLRPRSNNDVPRPELPDEAYKRDEITMSKVAVLCLGLAFIVQVPILRMLTGLPPCLGMLLALGLIWLLTDLFFLDKEEKDHGIGHRGVIAALFKVHFPSLLFFTGVLLSVGALNSAGILKYYANYMKMLLGKNKLSLCTVLGLSSSLIDNVPLVEAAIDMFEEVPKDDHLWQLVALAGGTGGSILIIGSVPGVTLMSTENVGFMWYCKRISSWAFLGYTFGIAFYQLQCRIIDI